MKTSLKAAMRKRPSGRRSWKIKLPPLKRAVCSDDKFLSVSRRKKCSKKRLGAQQILLCQMLNSRGHRTWEGEE